MIATTTIRRAFNSAFAALALTVTAGSFLAPAAQANSGPYIPNPPSGHPSKLQVDHRQSECFWFWDCRFTGSNWNFCDYDWWCHIGLYKMEIDYIGYDTCSDVELVQVKLFSYNFDPYHCSYSFCQVACGAGSIKTCKYDSDTYRVLSFAMNVPNDHLDTLFFEIQLNDCGSWGWYHELCDSCHFYCFGLTPFCFPY
jgi:hypothetical protein